MEMSKRRRVNSKNVERSNSNDGPKQTKLIDLNADCLQEIFQYLNTDELSCLVEANLTDCDDLEKAFNTETSARTHPYEATIRDRFLKIGNLYDTTNDPDDIWYDAKVFPYFGSMITHLSLCYHSKYHRYNAKMEQLILKYCTALTEIDFHNADECAFEDISKPFTKVKRIFFYGGYLSKTLGEFAIWFPALEWLLFDETKIYDSEFIEKKFPNLKRFKVKNKHLCRCRCISWFDFMDKFDYTITNANLKKFVELNPQLESLNITHDKNELTNPNVDYSGKLIQVDSEMLKFINIQIPQLQYLSLDIKKLSLFDPVLELTNFQTLTSLTVQFRRMDHLRQMNIMSDHLVELTLIVYELADYQMLSEFVNRFKNISYLWIEHWVIDVSNRQFINMIKSLHNLKTLNISFNENNLSYDLFYCISQFDRLTKLMVNCGKISYQSRPSVLNDINESEFLKKNHWKGVKGNLFSTFVFEKY